MIGEKGSKSRIPGPNYRWNGFVKLQWRAHQTGVRAVEHVDLISESL